VFAMCRRCEKFRHTHPCPTLRHLGHSETALFGDPADGRRIDPPARWISTGSAQSEHPDVTSREFDGSERSTEGGIDHAGPSMSPL